MTAPDLTARVLRSGALTVALLAAVLAWAAGPWVGLGVLGGGVVALGNFGGMAREVARLAALVTAGAPGQARLPRIGLRQALSLGALAGMIGLGWAHPVGVAVGLASLPPVLLVEGLRAARAAA